ncbi:MAG: DUF2156 domain-containing protein [Ruminococcus sp.]|nr:DUF2156 domain-containing protein [Ruminococcus sp.]
MLNFKLIEKKDINYFKQFYDYSEAFGCDINLLNAYLWRNEFNIKFAVYDDTLIKAYFNNEKKVWGYCMPTGKNVKQALEQILIDAQQRGQKPQIVMMTNAQRAMLESTFPFKFEFVRSPENQDYIYNTKDLVMLAGKKFHAKRNHISKFYKTYTNTRFETIDNSNEQDVLQVVKDWCSENGYNPKGYEELAVIEEALEMREDFGMSGAVLYVEDKPVAMTLGSEISDKVYDINFEKALRQYDGVYAVINNEFAKMLTSYEYINREEDMGIEGLRKSKLSYNPVMILDRFNATLK